MMKMTVGPPHRRLDDEVQLVESDVAGHFDVGVYERMKEVEEKLQDLNFCRGNKGYLINLQHFGNPHDFK